MSVRFFESAAYLDGKLSSDAQEPRAGGHEEPREARDVWEHIPAPQDNRGRNAQPGSDIKTFISHTFLFSRVFPVKLEPPASWVPE